MYSFLKFGLSCISGFLLLSCENDLKDIEKISAKKNSVQVDKSYGVEVIFSDSAKVKGKLITPELHDYKTANPYFFMPKGVTVIFYDENQQETQRITADEGIRRQNEKLIELRKNVIVTTKKGDIFKSEELFYDENKKSFYSNLLVNITKLDGTNIYGTKFISDQNFENPVIDQATGNIPTGGTLPF
ncbi:MAG: LPS export ABC transporter periplasmic protein LptC [Pyrinomonadaceae bacterium]|nr:LPS export ABC transporter periplasmic protein LptC [Sphingobacteriaceae bacterium]